MANTVVSNTAWWAIQNVKINKGGIITSQNNTLVNNAI